MIRVFNSRSALGFAIAASIMAVGAISPALAQKESKQKPERITSGFAKVAGPFQKAVNDAKARPNIIALKGKPAELSAALAAEKTQFQQVLAAAETPFDKFNAGALGVPLGQLAEDPTIVKTALQTMIDSGKAPNTPDLLFFLGQANFQLKDYAGAQTALQAAIAAGYRSDDVQAQLAQAYINGGNPSEGTVVLRKAIEAKQAAGGPAPQSWYRVGVGAAFRAKRMDQASFFSLGLVQYYPDTENWSLAIAVLRDVANYQAQENLDLMRLMGRTQSFAEELDYLEYIKAADARRFPGEVLQVIDAGAKSGKLRIGSTFVTEAKTTASGRVTADRASLPTLERDARAPTAQAATIAAAADTFLSYGDTAKAIDLYTLALSKPGGDAARLNTRLGIAQFDKGDYAAARASFAKVDGPRRPLAELWGIHAAHKAAGK